MPTSNCISETFWQHCFIHMHKLSTRCCSRKPHSSSWLILIRSTGVESCPHWWTPLYYKLQHSILWPKWVTVGDTNPWRKQLISLVWSTTGAIEGVHIFCYCHHSIYSNWSYCQAHITCGSSRHVWQNIKYVQHMMFVALFSIPYKLWFAHYCMNI